MVLAQPIGLAKAAQQVPDAIYDATALDLNGDPADREEGQPVLVPPTYMFVPVDIDKDGRTDWQVNFYRGGGQGFCGTGGCQQQIYVANDRGGFDLVFDEQVNSIRFEPGNQSSSLIVIDVHGSFCGGAGNSECLIALRWDATRRLLVPTRTPTTTSSILTFDPLPRAKREIPAGVAEQASKMTAFCRGHGFSLGEGQETSTLRPSMDFNGDGVTDWLVGIEAYCQGPEPTEGAEPIPTPPLPVVLMVSDKGGFAPAAESANGGFSVDISTDRPVFVAEMGGGCRSWMFDRCDTLSYGWNAVERRMQPFHSDPLAADDAAFLAELERAATTPAKQTTIGSLQLTKARALVNRLASDRAPNDVLLAKVRLAAGILLLENGQNGLAEEFLRRSRDALLFAGEQERRKFGLAQLYLAKSITDPARGDERRYAFAMVIQVLEGAEGIDSWAVKRAYEGYVGRLYREAEFQIDREKLAKLVATDVGRGPEAWGDRREIDRYAAGLARHEFRWSEALAIDQATIARYSQSGGAKTASLAYDYGGLALDLVNLARFAEAEHAARTALAINEAAFGPKDTRSLSARSDLGQILFQGGKAEEADALQQQVVASFDTSSDPQNHDLPLAYRRLAESAMALGRLSEAGTLLEKARGAEDALDAQYILSSVYQRAATTRMLGRLQVLTGQGVAGAATFADSLVAVGRLDSESLAMLLDYLEFADAYANDDQRALIAAYADAPQSDSLSICEQVLALAQQVYKEPHPAIARARRLLARALVRQKSPDAPAALEAALEATQALAGDGTVIGHEARIDLASYLTDNGEEGARALTLAREAVAIARARRAQLRSGAGAAVEPSIRQAFMTLAGVIARSATRSDPLMDEAFRTLQEVEVSQAGQAVARAALARQASNTQAASLLAEFNAAEERLAALERLYIGALTNGDGEGIHRLQDSLAGARAQVQTLDRALRETFPTYAALADQQPSSIASARARLAENETIVLLSHDASDMIVFALSRTAAQIHRAAGYMPDFKRDLAALRCTVDPGNCPTEVSQPLDTRLAAAGWKSDDPRLPFDRAAAQSIFAHLIQPVTKDIPAGQTLLLVQHGEIGKLSLAMLPVDNPAGEDPFDPAGMRHVHWLVDRHALVLLPAVAVLGVESASKEAVRGAQSFLGFGNPALSGSVANGRGVSRMFVRGGSAGWMAAPKQIAQLSALPATQGELEAMAGVMRADPGSVVSGQNAREAKVKSDPRLARSRVVAFATHGLLPNELQGLIDPGLVFTPPATPSAEDDGVLTASEVTGLHLTADWVILSACNTASSDGSPGADALSALARSFLLSGAGSVLASRWSVPDASTAALTVSTMEAYQNSGVSRARALQQGMVNVREGHGTNDAELTGWKPEWRHPVFWAGFVLISTEE
jgi:CHAT domain-containing protein